MPTFTAFLNLIKPAGSEVIDISQINDNMDDIDTFASGTDSRLDTIEALLANATELTSLPGSGWTLGTSWTVTDFHAYKIGRMRFIDLAMVWGGSTITGSAAGNITDNTLFSAIPSDWTPTSGHNAIFPFQVAGTSMGNGSINASSTITLQTLHATGTISNGDTIRASAAYYV